MTKNEKCNEVLVNWRKQQGYEANSKIPESDILYSGVLAVAMEHLNLLTEDRWKDYAQSRAGIMRLNERGCSTFRGLLDRLDND